MSAWHRRKRIRESGSNHSSIYDKSNGRCWYCGCEIFFQVTTEALHTLFTVDHLIPVANGGRTTPKNLVPSCYRCNHTKSSFTLEEFRLILGYQKAGWPKFTINQCKFLKRHGIELPTPPTQYIFYFETMSLEP